MTARRRVRFQESFWTDAVAAFPPHRTDDGRPSIEDFRHQGVQAVTFDFERDELLPAEPGSPVG